MEALENSANSAFSSTAVFMYIGVRLDLICIVFAVFTVGFCVLGKDKFDKTMLIFSLNIIIDLIVLFSISVRLGVEINNFMTCS